MNVLSVYEAEFFLPKETFSLNSPVRNETCPEETMTDP